MINWTPKEDHTGLLAFLAATPKREAPRDPLALAAFLALCIVATGVLFGVDLR